MPAFSGTRIEHTLRRSLGLSICLFLLSAFVPVSAFAQLTQWTGSVSISWWNSSNWNAGIPDSTISVQIKDKQFDPWVSDTAHILDLDIMAGGTLNFEDGAVLIVHGTGEQRNNGTINLGGGQIIFKNNVTIFNGGEFNADSGSVDMNGGTWENKDGATFDAGTSTFTFNGDSDQVLIGDMTFYNVVVENSDGTITFTDDVTVTNSMVLDSGTTVVSDGSLTLESGATLVVEDSSSLIVNGTFNNNGTITGGGTITSAKPLIQSVAATSTTTVDVTFSEPVDATTSQVTSNYSVDNSVTVSGAVIDASNAALVHLTVSTLSSDITYTITINNVIDSTLTDTIGTNSQKSFTFGGTPDNIIVIAGSDQSAEGGTAFATNLQAKVRDANGLGLYNVEVVFRAPSSGASGTFATSGTNEQTVFTDGNGIATAPTFTANFTTGSYAVTAEVSGVTTSASFSLTNLAASNNPIPSISSISPTSKTIGDTSFALTVNGSGFISSSVVRFNGNDRTTTHIGSAQLSAQISTSDIDTAGAFSVTVFNPSPGGGLSNADSLTVNKAVTAIVVTSANDTTTYGDSLSFTATVSSSGGVPPGAVEFFNGATPLGTQALASGQATLNLGTFNAGTHKITASYGGNVNFLASASDTIVQTVLKANQTITFDALTDKTFGDPPFEVTATASSGLAVSLSVVGGPATISDDTVTITGAGTVTIRASQPGDANYNAAPDVDRSFNVAKAAATLTFGNLSQTYDGSPKTVTVTTDPSGLDTVTVTYDGSTSPPTNAGNYVVVASLSNPNYQATPITDTMRVAKATATLTLSNLSHTYDGTSKAATVTTSPEGLSGVSVTYDGSSTAPTNAGSYAVAASLTNPNYQAADATGTLTINKADQTITFNAIPDKTFGDPPFVLTAIATSGLPVSFSVVSGPVSVSNDTVTINGTGSATIRASQTGNENFNAAPVVDRTFTISAANATLLLSNLVLTYDGSPKAVTVTTDPTGLDTVTVTYNGSTTPPTNAGVYVVVASLQNPDYQAANVTDSLRINKAGATLTLSNLTHTYDGLAKAATVTTNPASLDTVTITYNGSTTAPSAAGNYVVVASLNNPNFEASPITDTLRIGKASSTLSVSNLSHTYDGTAKAATVTTDPVGLSGVAVTYNGSATAPTNSGNYVVVASLTNQNYEAIPVTDTLRISKATASLSLNNLSQTYDGSAKAVTVTTNPPGLDTVTVTYNGSTTVPTNSGSYSVVAVLTNPNFEAPQATGTLVIAKATATIAIDNLLQTFDGTPKPVTVTTTPVGLSGLTVSYNGSTTAPMNAGSYDVLATLTNLNYTANDAAATLVVEKANQTITFDSISNKSLGDPPFVLAATSSSGLPVVFSLLSGPATLSVDTVSLTGVGTVIVRATQGGNNNYNTAPAVERSFFVSPGSLAGFRIVPVQSQRASRSFDLTIEAKDSSGNTVTAFGGSVSLSADSGLISPSSAGPFLNGTSTLPVTLYRAGTRTITASDGSGHEGSLKVDVDPSIVAQAVKIPDTSTAYVFQNLGLTLEFTDKLPQQLTVQRVLGIAWIGNGNESVMRSYEIDASVDSALNVVMTFSFEDMDLNGHDPTRLNLWRSLDQGVTWRRQGGEIDPVQRTITKSRIPSFSLWTAADTTRPLGSLATEWVASSVAKSAGDSSSAVTGSVVAPLVVRVTDAFGNLIAGVPVSFAIAGVPTSATGQQLSVTSSVTNSQGLASTTLTLGNKVGTYTVTASASGLSGSPVEFRATATNAAPALVKAFGNLVLRQGTGPYVITEDLNGHFSDMNGDPLTYSVVSSTGGLVPTIESNRNERKLLLYASSDFSGDAFLTVTADDRKENGVVTARIDIQVVASSLVASSIVLAEGNNQSGVISTQLPDPLVVTVLDSSGNPVPSVDVSFVLTTNPDSSTGQEVSVPSAKTNSFGQASTYLTIGNKIGEYVVEARSNGLTGSPIAFRARGTHGVAVRILEHSGDEQSAEVNLALPMPLVVRVVDAGGNPVPNVPVSFRWASFPENTSGHKFEPASGTSDSLGRIGTTVTFGNRAGYYVVEAVAEGLSGSPVAFTTTAIAAAAVTLTSGNNQRAAVGTVLRNPFVVTVTDQLGLPVEGTEVEFTIIEKPANAVGEKVSVPKVVTNAQGQASTGMTLGDKAGAYKVRATWTALPGNPVDFAAFATAGAASQLSAATSLSKKGIVGERISEPLRVLVLDSLGNAVPDVLVEFSFGTIPEGAEGQALSAASVLTDSTGHSSIEVTLGNRAGGYSVLATSSNLDGSPLEFSCLAVGVSRLVLWSGDNQSAPTQQQTENPLVAALLDSVGNGISGAPIVFAVSSTPSGATGASVHTDTVVTNVSGHASTEITLGSVVGFYGISAAAPGFSTPAVEFLVSATRAAAFSIERLAGDDQIEVVNTRLDTMKVLVKDAAGVPIEGVGVTFSFLSLPSGASGQRLSITRTFTNNAGQAATVLTLGNRLGEYVVQVKSSGLSDAAMFSAVATAGAPASIAQSSGNHQRAAIKTTLPNKLAVLLADQGGNPVEGAAVSFSLDVVPPGAQGQRLDLAQVTTNSEGIAGTTFTLGDKVGTYTILASSPSLPDKSVSFAVVATGGAPSFIAHSSGNNQQAVINTALPFPFSVSVTDSGNNPISGVRVTFAIDSVPSGAIGHVLSATNVITDGSGRAAAYMTLGNKIGKYRVSVSSVGLDGSPVRFEANATPDQSASLILVDGNSQIAAVGTTLIDTFKVVVSSGEGVPLPGITVAFSIQTTPSGAQGQFLNRTIVETDSLGRATSLLTLGNVPGIYTVAATAAGLSGSPVLFNVVAVRSAIIAATEGENQTASIGSLLQRPFTVTVRDSAGEPLQGVRVRFFILSAPSGATGQNLSVTTATTDFLGHASTLLRLGIRPGQYRILASAPGMIGSPLSFYASATMISGDANNDTQVNIADVTAVIDHILGRIELSPANQVRADVNGNGRVEVHDAVALVNTILEMTSLTQASVEQTLNVRSEASQDRAPPAYQAEFELTPAGVRFNLNNTEPLKGLQLVFRLKNGATLSRPDIVFPRLEKMHVPLASRNGEVRLIVYNLENKEIPAGSGPLFRLPIQVQSLDDIEILQVIASSPANTGQTVATIKEVPTAGKYPQTFVLEQNYPNPFNAGTTIRFEIPETPSMLVRAELEIFDILGRRVRGLISGDYDVGRYSVTWDGRDEEGATVPSGVYFYRLKAVTYDGARAAEVTGRSGFDKVFTKKMLMIK